MDFNKTSIWEAILWLFLQQPFPLKKKKIFFCSAFGPLGSKLYCKFKGVLYKSNKISIGIDDLLSLLHLQFLQFLLHCCQWGFMGLPCLLGKALIALRAFAHGCFLHSTTNFSPFSKVHIPFFLYLIIRLLF